MIQKILAPVSCGPSAFNPPTQLWIPDRDMVLKNHEAKSLGLDPSRKWNQAGFALMISEGAIPVILREESDFSFPRLAAFTIFQTLDASLGGVKYLLHLLRNDIVDEGCCDDRKRGVHEATYRGSGEAWTETRGAPAGGKGRQKTAITFLPGQTPSSR
jgi:hypothetical protein